MSTIKNIKAVVKWKMNRSEAGYFHVPILHISWGSDGFQVCIVGVMFLVQWDVVEVEDEEVSA